jgi:diguanylate cyclase (GGDEF)-like protein
MEEENRKDNLGQITPAESRALSDRSASLMRRGLRSLSGWDSVIIEIGKALTSSLLLDQILRTIMEKVDEFLHPNAWSIRLVDEDKQELYFELVVGKGAEALKDVRIKIGEGVAGWVAQHNETVVVPDVSRDTRFFSRADEKTKTEIGSLVAVPMRHRDRCLGVMELTKSIGRESLSQADVSLLEAVADFAAVAVENAQHVRRLHKLSITNEQTKLYNERHLSFILDTELYRSQRYGYSFSILRIDLDEFRELAGSLSYTAFNRLLNEVGKSLRAACRLIDFAFYVPDGEFIMILPQAGKDAACQYARRLHKSIRERVWLENLNVHLAARIGVACYPDDAKTKEELIQSVNEATQSVENSSLGGVAVANVGLLDPL